MSALNRRAFLRGSAGALITLPMLNSWPRRAEAQTTPSGKFILVAHPLGMYPEQFFPTPPGGTPYAFPSVDVCNPQTTRCRPRTYRTGESFLSHPEFQLSRTLEPFAPYRDELLVIENIDNYSGNHKGYTCMTTGRSIDGSKLATGISVDQALAGHLGQDTRFPALQLGVKSGTKPHSRHVVSWYGAGRAAVPESSPERVFDRLFSDIMVDDDALSRLRAQQRSVLDAALDQASALKSSLGRNDQIKIDDYLDSIREVERRLSRPLEAGCQRPDAPPSGYDFDDLDLVPQTTLLQLDMLAMAMACDLTRVATFQMGYEATNMTHPWLNVSTRWHDLSHTSGNESDWIDLITGYVNIARWNAEQIAYLIDRLKGLGVWDDTLILWTTPMHNAQYHNGFNIPVTLIGNVQNKLSTGRHVRFEAGKHKINDVLLTVQQLFGMDVNTFGASDGVNRALHELLA